MVLNATLLRDLTRLSGNEAWAVVVKRVFECCSSTLDIDSVPEEIIKRDREVGLLDHFLATSGWDMWRDFEPAVESTSDRLVRWWAQPFSSKAVLILDGLSLRELPWLLYGAEKYGFNIQGIEVTASELPGETNRFAQALGFSSRSQLQNNGAAPSHRFVPAKTESVNLPWKDCENLIDATPDWVFWHHWPDEMIHGDSGAGEGLTQLSLNAASQLTSMEFWEFAAKLSNGRRLLITSDHGYAATGLFHDTTEEQARFLKETFKNGRFAVGSGDVGPFVPPVAMQLDGRHGQYIMAVGRRKWKSQGGYPTLAHGGLSLLEVLCPFVELTK